MANNHVVYRAMPMISKSNMVPAEVIPPALVTLVFVTAVKGFPSCSLSILELFGSASVDEFRRESTQRALIYVSG